MLIDSAKLQIDEKNKKFQPTLTFRKGVQKFEEAQRTDLMSPRLLERKATVYSG